MYGMYEIIDVRRRKETPKKPHNSKKYYKWQDLRILTVTL